VSYGPGTLQGMEGPNRGVPEAGPERPGEGALQRADRNMLELLQEMQR
jgi:hypothetical protein